MNQINRFFIGLKEEQGITVWYAVGWIGALITLLTALNSTFVFLFVLNSGFVRWIFLNTCAIFIFSFFLGYVFKSPLTMIISSVFLFRYGFLGLFVFSWQGVNLFAQFGHIMMSISIGYTLFLIVKEKIYRTLIFGVVIGVLLMLSFEIFLHEPWINANPETFKALFRGELKPW